MLVEAGVFNKIETVKVVKYEVVDESVRETDEIIVPGVEGAVLML